MMNSQSVSVYEETGQGAFAPAPVLASDEIKMFVTATVGGQMLGFPIGKVREIFYIDRIFPVPEAPSHIAGLINLRGRIILVADMCSWLEFPVSRSKNEERLCLAIEIGDEVYGLLVDEIGDILSLPVRGVCLPPSGLSERWKRICSGVYMLERSLLLGVDAAPIFDGHKPSDVRSYLPTS